MKKIYSYTGVACLALLTIRCAALAPDIWLTAPLKVHFRKGLFVLKSQQQVHYKGDLETEPLLAESTFPIKETDLIDLAKEFVLVKKVGLADNAESIAENFSFRAAFGEVHGKREYISTLKAFQLEESFDITQQTYGWMVDPLQTNRVYFMNRQEAVHARPLFGLEPTNKTLILPPQLYHVDFNEDGKVVEYGFYTVDCAQGNTGGLGGAYGFFYGVGRPLPFPEGKPYQMSFQRHVLAFLVNLAERFQKQ